MKSRSILALILVFTMLFSCGVTRVFAEEDVNTAEPIVERQNDDVATPGDISGDIATPGDLDTEPDPDPDPNPDPDPEPDQPPVSVDPKISASATANGARDIEPLGAVNVQVIVNLTDLDEAAAYTLNIQLKTSDGTTVMDSGSPVERNISVSGKSSGTESAALSFDASNMAGKSVVAVETLYKDGVAVAGPTSASDTRQTIYITSPSLMVSATNPEDGSNEFKPEDVSVAVAANYSGLVAGNEYKAKITIKDKNSNTVAESVETFTAGAEAGTEKFTVAADVSEHEKETLTVEVVISRLGHTLASSSDSINVSEKEETPVDPDPVDPDPQPVDPEPDPDPDPKPVDPVDPVDPDPVDPVEPSDPSEPSNPSEPDKPADPEKPSDPKPVKPSDNDKPAKPANDATTTGSDDTEKPVENPKTGDENNMVFWIAAMILSACTICACSVMLSRQAKKHDE